MTDSGRPKNRLATATSPYLLQHATNPVDWYPWGEEALAKSKAEDKPILLSVGYSACHWCHVMERESFEDPAIAARMNDWFVCIKVDREERPDVDQRYQHAVQLLGRGGGWPLTAFLQPTLEPFYAGTYFPPVRRYGRPSFGELLEALHEAWTQRRDEVRESAAELSDAVARLDREALGSGGVPPDLVEKASESLLRRWDDDHAGFGERPKFPNTLSLELWLRRASMDGGEAFGERAIASLVHMADGGIHDQLGGGFHRYSTDERWLVPHFEKMLYDNGLLLRALAQAHALKPDPRLRRAAEGIVTWLSRELTAADGAFFSAQDADSEGEEGRFFAFTPGDVGTVLGTDDAAFVCEALGISDEGNFEHGRSVLHRTRALSESEEKRLDPLRRKLFEARAARVPPATDDKVLAAWNGLAIHGLALAGAAFGEPSWIARARTASRAVAALLDKDDRLLRAARHGVAHTAAFAEDHAFLLEAELALFSATGEPWHVERARSLASRAVERFVDPASGAVYVTPADATADGALPDRPIATYDNAVPGAASSLAHGLLRLHALDGDPRWSDAAERIVGALAASTLRNPFGFAYLACAADAWLRGITTVVVTGSDATAHALADRARRAFHPNLLVVAPTGPLPPALASLVGAKPAGSAAFVCRRGTCSLPVTSPDDLAARLASDARMG